MQRYCLIMCRSLTNARRSAQVLERAGITATVRKAPQSISGEGCSYCVKIDDSRRRRALEVLERASLRTGKIYLLEADGALREVTE